MLGQYLKRHRLNNNLSQAEMAARLGTSQSYYSQLEGDVKKPGIKLIGRISRELNLEPAMVRNLL